jgi:hypothetical protein
MSATIGTTLRFPEDFRAKLDEEVHRRRTNMTQLIQAVFEEMWSGRSASQSPYLPENQVWHEMLERVLAHPSQRGGIEANLRWADAFISGMAPDSKKQKTENVRSFHGKKRAS